MKTAHLILTSFDNQSVCLSNAISIEAISCKRIVRNKFILVVESFYDFYKFFGLSFSL